MTIKTSYTVNLDGNSKVNKMISADDIKLNDLIEILKEISKENGNENKIISCCGITHFFIHTFDKNGKYIVIDTEEHI